MKQCKKLVEILSGSNTLEVDMAPEWAGPHYLNNFYVPSLSKYFNIEIELEARQSWKVESLSPILGRGQSSKVSPRQQD